MPRPLCSVVMAAFDRAHLLARSLACYARQDFDPDRFELVVVDDHSTDHTRQMCLDWAAATGVRTTVLTVAPKPGPWVDCAWVLNAGIRAAAGDHILLTHPEVMPGRRSVAACVEQLIAFDRDRDATINENVMTTGTPKPVPFGLYAACKPYYLSPAQQELIDTVPWLDEGALAVRQIPGFYEESLSPEFKGHPDYTPHVIDKIGTPGYRTPSGADGSAWRSWVFGGCSRETWRRLGGMVETQKWGSVDLVFNVRRLVLGVRDWTATEEDAICVHQDHSSPADVPTPRDMDAAHAEASRVQMRPELLQFPAVDYI